MGTSPRVGISLFMEDAFRAAAYPLFQEGLVDALEWTIDTAWGLSARPLPRWVGAILDAYSEAGALYGHGVMLSTLSARWTGRQERWLARLAAECRRRRYMHVSEHFGFMTAGPVIRRGTPLPVPFVESAVRIGQDRLRRLSDAAGVAIGLENLATALGPADVEDQGMFIDVLLASTNGFLLLDLHNLYCQSLNFGVPFETLLNTYPLGRVRELHLSGGSWSSPRADPRPFRRDTHDHAVPDALLAMLPGILGRCPALEVVILERLGFTFRDEADAEQYRQDYRRIRAIVREGARPRAVSRVLEGSHA